MSQKILDGKKKLIEEAKTILVNEGYKKLSIRKLALKCGIGIGTFYNYFSSKEEIVTEIFKDDWMKIVKEVDNLKSVNMEFKEKLSKIYSDIYDFVNNYNNIFQEIIFSEGNSLKRNQEIIKQIYIKLSELIDEEVSKKIININIDSEKMAYMIIQNFIYMSRDKYLTFDEFYYSLNF